MQLVKAFSLLFFSLLALSGPTSASAQTVPNPTIRFVGTQPYATGGRNFIRYRYEVTNLASYPAHMFQAAPGLPPCGANANSSRTWVDLFRQDGTRLYGFCALDSPSTLSGLWFGLPEGEAPPPNIYIEMKDRMTNQVYRSNLATTGPSPVMSQAQARTALASGRAPTMALILAACDYGDQAGPGSTPTTISGAVTASAREAKCILDTLGNRVVVLAAVHDSRRLPGARDVDWANSGGPEDSNQAAFAAMLTRLTEGNRQRPLLIYCHNESCPLSPVVVRRAVAAGYSTVFWLRQGIDGWSRAGFAFENAR